MLVSGVSRRTAKATGSCHCRASATPINRHRLTARTAGKSRTSSTNFASKGDVLSLLHASASVRGMFRSTTEDTTTVSGTPPACRFDHPSHSQAARYETQDGRLVHSLLNDVGRFQTAAITFMHQAVVEHRAWRPGNQMNGASVRSRKRSFLTLVSGCPLGAANSTRCVATGSWSKSRSAVGMKLTNPASSRLLKNRPRTEFGLLPISSS